MCEILTRVPKCKTLKKSNSFFTQFQSVCVCVNYFVCTEAVMRFTARNQLTVLYCPCSNQWFPPQFSSVAQSCPTLCSPMDCSTPGLPVHYQLPELAQTHVHWVGDAIQPSHPLSSPSPPALSLSQHQVFSSESAFLIRWPKYWSFSFNISPSNDHSRLISFRMDWLDLLAVQGTLKSPSSIPLPTHSDTGQNDRLSLNKQKFQNFVITLNNF